LSFDPVFFEKLDGGREKVKALAQRRRAADAQLKEIHEAERQLKQNETMLERSKTEADRAAQELEFTTQKARQVEGQLAEARRREAAAFLRTAGDLECALEYFLKTATGFRNSRGQGYFGREPSGGRACHQTIQRNRSGTRPSSEFPAKS
jgi:hypothetical protein